MNRNDISTATLDGVSGRDYAETVWVAEIGPSNTCIRRLLVAPIASILLGLFMTVIV